MGDRQTYPSKEFRTRGGRKKKETANDIKMRAL